MPTRAPPPPRRTTCTCESPHVEARLYNPRITEKTEHIYIFITKYYSFVASHYHSFETTFAGHLFKDTPAALCALHVELLHDAQWGGRPLRRARGCEHELGLGVVNAARQLRCRTVLAVLTVLTVTVLALLRLEPAVRRGGEQHEQEQHG